MNNKISKMDKKSYGESCRRLLWWNQLAGLVHAASFVAALVVTLVYLQQSLQTELSIDFRSFTNTPPLNAPPAAGSFETTLRSLGYYQVSWVDLPFPLITAAFHLVIAWNARVGRWYCENALAKGGDPLRSTNVLRWVEYSITASLMVWVISQLSGVTNILLLIAQVFINVGMQLQGYLMELLNYYVRFPRCTATDKAVITIETPREINYGPLIVGFLLFVAQWTIILTHFIAFVVSRNAPWFVYVIVIGLSVQFLFFGLVMTFHYTNMLPWFRNAENNEWAYLLLSLTTKLFLTWTLLIGIALNPFGV